MKIAAYFQLNLTVVLATVALTSISIAQTPKKVGVNNLIAAQNAKQTAALLNFLEEERGGEYEGELENAPQKVASLIKSGANLNARSKKGLSLVRLALSNSGDLKTARLLLESGAPADATDRLFAAIVGRNPVYVAQCLRSGANPNGRDRDGWSMLMWAASYGQTPVVRQLLHSGAASSYKSGKSRDNARDVAFMYLEDYPKDAINIIHILERSELQERLRLLKRAKKQN